MPIDTQKIDSLFRNAVVEGVAPGLQYVVFNKDGVLLSEAAGLSRPISEKDVAGVPLLPQTPVNLASAGKIFVSIVVLRILERGLAHNGMTLDDIDNHDKLVEILPEFGAKSDSWAGKLLVGFEPELDAEGKKVPILTEPTNKVTLRHFLTHTAGHPYFWMDGPTMQFYYPSDGSVALKAVPILSGKISDLEVPMVTEPGTYASYGSDTDWLGIFASRATGRGFHRLVEDYVLNPLNIPATEFHSRRTKHLNETLATAFFKQPDGTFAPTDLDVYGCDDDIPPPGYFHIAAGPAIGSTRMFTRVLQAVMQHDTTLLEKKTWEIATVDSLKQYGIQMPKPRWESLVDLLSIRVDEYSPAATPEGGASINLLQAEIAVGPRRSGRPDGSYGWAGRHNSFWAIDEKNGLGYAFTSHVLPFGDHAVLKLRDDLEKLIWSPEETTSTVPEVNHDSWLSTLLRKFWPL